MFKILKERLKKVVQSISKKFEEKEQEIPEKIKEMEFPLISEEKSAIMKGKKIEEIKPEVKITEKIEKVEIPEEKKGLVKKLVEKVVKKVVEKKLGEEDINPMLKDLENGLIEADVAVEVAGKITEDLKNDIVGKEIRRGKEKELIVLSLKNSLLDILNIENLRLEEKIKEKKPYLILFLGFNGSGKTTSLAKTAKWLMDKGYSVVFAAADTFRAAAEEQLEEHAKKIGVKVIKHKYGADPAAVIFDSIEYAKSKGIDFVLADSAGRAHTNRNLMDQLKKIVKVNKPDLKILVIDSLTGNDAIIQARMFNEVGVDALIFTKVDVNEKGGAILSVTHELKKPIIFLGIGQRYEDFIKFEANDFVNNLVS